MHKLSGCLVCENVNKPDSDPFWKHQSCFISLHHNFCEFALTNIFGLSYVIALYLLVTKHYCMKPLVIYINLITIPDTSKVATNLHLFSDEQSPVT